MKKLLLLSLLASSFISFVPQANAFDYNRCISIANKLPAPFKNMREKLRAAARKKCDQQNALFNKIKGVASTSTSSSSSVTLSASSKALCVAQANAAKASARRGLFGIGKKRREKAAYDKAYTACIASAMASAKAQEQQAVNSIVQAQQSQQSFALSQVNCGPGQSKVVRSFADGSSETKCESSQPQQQQVIIQAQTQTSNTAVDNNLRAMMLNTMRTPASNVRQVYQMPTQVKAVQPAVQQIAPNNPYVQHSVNGNSGVTVTSGQ